MNDWKLRIKQAREAKQLNKTEFARLVGVSNATVTDWEKSSEDGGIKELSGPKLAKISEILEVDPHWIMSGKVVGTEAATKATGAAQGNPSDAQGLRQVEPEVADLLQWITAREAALLTEFRACAEPQKKTLMQSARGLKKAISAPDVTASRDKA